MNRKRIVFSILIALICCLTFNFQTNVVKAEESTDNANIEYDINNGFYMTFDESMAEKLRDNNFKGYLYFEYFDDGTENFKVYTDTSRDSDDNGDYSIVCSINKGDTGEWVQAKVEIYKENCAFTHEGENNSDFTFKGDAKVKNISFEFEIFKLK